MRGCGVAGEFVWEKKPGGSGREAHCFPVLGFYKICLPMHLVLLTVLASYLDFCF